MTFHDLNLNSSLLKALDDLSLTEPTAIQSKSFSPIMAGSDVVGIAQTGTGKTYAYLLPSLRLWKFSKSPAAQILIIVPTRELVAQVVEEVKKLTTYLTFQVVGVYGGANIRRQIDEVQAGVDMVVGTPGRLLDLMLKGALKTKNIKRLIIDEVDEMLNLGFRTQLNNLVEFLPAKRQNLMFSATMPSDVEQIVDTYSDYYQKIETAPSGAPLKNIDQLAYRVDNFNTKANLLQLLLDSTTEMSKVLVFVSTKKMADALYERLAPFYEESLGVIHSSKSQNNRFKTVNSFQEGIFRSIIATDVIARGIDVSMVTHVINFDLSDVPESYIHRIGRTGRAGEKGVALSFVSEKELSYKANIEGLTGTEVPWLDLPTDLVKSEELIDLEIVKEHIPFNHHKMRQHKRGGEAFQEKSEKNKKTNSKVRYEDVMKKKYKRQYKKKVKKR